jgi:hypothetical protein
MDKEKAGLAKWWANLEKTHVDRFVAVGYSEQEARRMVREAFWEATSGLRRGPTHG